MKYVSKKFVSVTGVLIIAVVVIVGLIVSHAHDQKSASTARPVAAINKKSNATSGIQPAQVVAQNSGTTAAAQSTVKPSASAQNPAPVNASPAPAKQQAPTAKTTKPAATSSTASNGRPVTAITNMTLTLGQVACSGGNRYYPYSYAIDFNSGTTDVRISPDFEYEYVTPIPPSEFQPHTPTFPLSNYAIGAGTVRVSDPVPYWRGFQPFSLASYRMRLHTTSPNNAYSNWVTIDHYSTLCG